MTTRCLQWLWQSDGRVMADSSSSQQSKTNLSPLNRRALEQSRKLKLRVDFHILDYDDGGQKNQCYSD